MAEHEFRPKSSGDLDSTSEISYLYLTFETTLPAANTTIATSSARGPKPPPEAPDLKRFVDPHLWPEARKNLLLVLSCMGTFLSAYAAGSYSPPSLIIAREFGTSQDAALTGITAFCLGFGLAPMFLAPLSEICGRYPVFVVSGVVYVLSQVACGLANSLVAMVLARLLVGIGSSVFSTVIGGVIADIWHAKERNRPMAIFTGTILVGTGIGPLVSSVMTERLGDQGSAWRWVFWHQAITATVAIVTLAVLFKESRGSALLSMKAATLNRWYEKLESAGYYGMWAVSADFCTETEKNSSRSSSRPSTDLSEEEVPEKPQSLSWASPSGPRRVRIRWLVKADEERSSIWKMIAISVHRPFSLLFTESVVFFFSLWAAFAWAALYLTFSSVFYVFENVYDWNVEQCGRIFVAMAVGACLAAVAGIYQDGLLRLSGWQPDSVSESRFWAMMRRRFPVNTPESRLYCSCITSTLLPLGLYLFGFTARADVHWSAPAIAIGLATMGIYSVYLAATNYMTDVYHKYASSALAAQSCLRNILSGVFPLVTSLLFKNLGVAPAGALLGGIATLLTFVPWILVFHGEKIRRRSKFASVSSILSLSLSLSLSLQDITTLEHPRLTAVDTGA